MRYFPRCAVVLTLFVLSGCVGYAAPETGHEFTVKQNAGVNPWTSLSPNDSPDSFQFVIISDRTGGMRRGVFQQAVSKVNMLQPEFVICVGDLIPGYTEDQEELEEQWNEFVGIAEGFEMPFFYVPGNHDISNPVMAEEWERRFGRSYYHFVYGNVLFLCLNTEDQRPGHISEQQVDYVRRALDEHRDAAWTMVYLHEPLWVMKPDDSGWSAVESLLEPRPHTVFAGHIHRYTHYRRHGRDYTVLATTGGGSSLQGPSYGTFDHVVWVTMRPDGPRFVNLMLDGIRGKEVFTEEMRRLLASARQGEAVSVDPVFVKGADFEAATTQLRLLNTADRPMSVTARFQPHPAIRVEPAALDIMVPAGSTTVRELRLEAGAPTPVDQLSVLRMDWHVSYEVPEGGPIGMDGASSLGIAGISLCRERTEPVVVDGRLDEWGELQHTCIEPRQIRHDRATWLGPADSSFRFDVRYDDDYLYVALRVRDDRLVLDPGRLPWQQDGVEVRLDARPDPERSRGRGGGEFTDLLLVALSPPGTAGRMVVYGRDRLPEGVQAACVKTENGYATEIAVPAAYLDGKQGGPWEAFRLNVAVDDFDEDPDSRAQIWWRPDWRTAASFPGSGTFARQ